MKLLFKQLIEKICFLESERIATSNHYQKQLIGSFAFILCILGCWTRPAQAEGSINLTSSGGDRPFLEYSLNSANSSKTAGIQRKTTIKVFVKNGETINLGSSAAGVNGTITGNKGTINYRFPTAAANTTSGTCNNAGKINNRTEETKGPFSGGYIPCTVTSTQADGIWEIDFVSPNSTGTLTNPNPRTAGADWAAPGASDTFVAAWDVTVTDKPIAQGGQAIPGRVFANYLALNMGSGGRSLSSAVYIKTVDGFLYSVDFNGLDPYAFILLSNKKGFTSGANGPALYRSIQLNDDDTFKSTDAVDSSLSGTNKIFFNRLSSQLPYGNYSSPNGSTWLNSPEAAPPSAPTNFSFIGKEANTPGKAGTSPLGGIFKFNVGVTGSYRIFLDFDNDNIEDPNDIILSGAAVVGANSRVWDGKDGQGNPVSANSSGYSAKMSVTANIGEVHFPYLDAESNLNGIKIERLNCDSDNPLAGCRIVYYNDGHSSLTVVGSQPVPLNALGGVDSTLGEHKYGLSYTNGYGNHKGIDTWTSVPSTSVSVESGGIILREADLQVTKTHSFPNAAVGNQITYTVTVTNKGPSDTSDIAVTDNIPAIITNVNWTCAITNNAAGSLTNACGAPSGSGNNLNTTLTLNKDAVATFTITGTVSNFGDLSNSVTAKTPLDVTDPNTTAGDYHTNTVTDTFIFGTSPIVTKTDVLVVDSDGSGGTMPLANQAVTPGDILEYGIVVTNPSTNIAINSVVLIDAIPANTTYIAGSLKVTTGTNTITLTDGAADDQAEVNGSELIFRLGTGANATTGGSLAASETTTVKFRIQVNDPLPNGITQVSNHALVSGSNFPNLNSNDPDTSTADDPTITRIAPRLRLVKRITAINTTIFTNVIDPTTTTDLNDNSNVRWSPNYLKGKVSDTIKPGDTIEYTIYFLSDGANIANNTTFCDRIPANTNFVADTFNSGYTANSMGLPADRGILWQYNGTIQSLTNISDGDAATYFFPGVEPSTVYPNINCQGSNTNGAIVVNLGSLPNATGAGTPASSYGFVRFRAKVQ